MSLAIANTSWKKFRRVIRFNGLPPPVKRIVVATLGITVVAVGVAMIVLPGPAFIMIPLGLAILATEFSWARRWLRKGRDVLKNTRNNWRKYKKRTASRPRLAAPENIKRGGGRGNLTRRK